MFSATSRALALMATLSLGANGLAQTDGWSDASGENRYGSAITPSKKGVATEPKTVNPGATVTPLPARSAAPPVAGPATSQSLAPVGSTQPTRARVTKGSGALPRDHGQVWREYDIRPYTLRVANTQHPEQLIVDWILRETGYEAWHSQPLGLLSAGRETLRVYHTPEMQNVVADIVDRFVNSQSESQAFSLRIATVRSPNWRARAMSLMTPIPVQSPGMQGWIMPKENAAMLLSDLTRRSDYREHSSSGQLVLNGQSIVLSTMRPRQYIKGIVRTQNTWPGFQPETGTLEEGASMEFSPLLTLDGATADAVVKIRINQVEKMQRVKLDVPSAVQGAQQMQIEVPQITMASIHERFRWPADHVLLLSMGVIAPPTPDKATSFVNMLPGVNAPPRADGLLFIDAKGTRLPSSAPGGTPSTASRNIGSFSGRY